MNSAAQKRGDKPLVSVITCFYNEEKFLQEAIQSVLSQSYDNWELFLVDDGSTDGSTEIARRYAARYPHKIFYLEHPFHQNQGLSASRNVGIKGCRGTYVAFLDADDVWLSGKLESQVRSLQEHPAATVLLEPSIYWKSWRDKDALDVVVPVGVAPGVYKPPFLSMALYPLGKGAAPCPSGIMVHRAVLRRCPFEDIFRGILQMYEDQAFLGKVYLKETVLVSGLCHNRYRQRASSLVAEAHTSGNYHKVRSHYLYWFKDYLHGQPFRFKSVERALRTAQMPYREPLRYSLTVDFPAQFKKGLVRLLIKVGVLNYSKSWSHPS